MLVSTGHGINNGQQASTGVPRYDPLSLVISLPWSVFLPDALILEVILQISFYLYRMFLKIL